MALWIHNASILSVTNVSRFSLCNGWEVWEGNNREIMVTVDTSTYLALCIQSKNPFGYTASSPEGVRRARSYQGQGLYDHSEQGVKKEGKRLGKGGVKEGDYPLLRPRPYQT